MPHTSHSSLVVQKVTLSMPRKRTKNSKSYHKQPPKPSRSITQQQLQSAGTLQYITKAGSGVSQSSCGPSAVRSGRSKKAIRERVICEPQADPDLINGSTYFKIGDPVYVRRWFDQDKEYSVWLLGKVMRPVFCNDRQGREERRYLVSYWDPRTKNEKEKIFSPSMKEITAVDMPTTTTTITAAVPVTGPSNCSMEASGYDNQSAIFALLPNSSGSGVWTPSICLGGNLCGYRVRALTGPLKDREFCNILDTMAYNAETARALLMYGHNVEKSAFFNGEH